MVNKLAAFSVLLAETGLAEANDTVLQRLDPERRAAVVLALVGLGFLGVLLIVVIMLGSRWARQERSPRGTRVNQTPQTKQQPETKVTYTETRRGETLADQPGNDETQF